MPLVLGVVGHLAQVFVLVKNLTDLRLINPPLHMLKQKINHSNFRLSATNIMLVPNKLIIATTRVQNAL